MSNQSEARLWGRPFVNSETCRGRGYATPDAPTDMAIIDIHGRYPEAGEFLRNRECSAMVYVVKGTGSIAIRGAELEEEIRAGDVMHIAPGQEYSWFGQQMEM